ncbi:MAG: glucosyltransferase [Blautia sp.]|nr:glucosyltransferase [Blautia sp.]MCM1202455.1 hypothetical protein [Bacteroides fragilis]
MSKIAFFCIPAHGHTNPTLAVVRELVLRGNEVWYYSYDSMKEKIESTGARFLSCDKYDMQMRPAPEDGARISMDLAFATEVLVETTLAVGKGIEAEMRAWKPDCIVADSMAVWGKAIARKLGCPFVSSTTTFAFNRESARTMKQSPKELFGMLFSIGKINRNVKRLRENGYPIRNILDIIQNDNETDTIVYTSPEFQPCVETFSEKYLFVGPSIQGAEGKRTGTARKEAKAREAGTQDRGEREKTGKQVYISLGTVNNDKAGFYRSCIAALRDMPVAAVISVGEMPDLEQLGEIPGNIRVERYVNQIEVLQNTDVFLTHCGMNSVSEALYFQVPLVLFPQTAEQQSVASRVYELGAGVYLAGTDAGAVRNAVMSVLETEEYRQKAVEIAESFYRCGGAAAAAEKIERAANPRRSLSAIDW